MRTTLFLLCVEGTVPISRQLLLGPEFKPWKFFRPMQSLHNSTFRCRIQNGIVYGRQRKLLHATSLLDFQGCVHFRLHIMEQSRVLPYCLFTFVLVRVTNKKHNNVIDEILFLTWWLRSCRRQNIRTDCRNNSCLQLGDFGSALTGHFCSMFDGTVGEPLSGCTLVWSGRVKSSGEYHIELIDLAKCARGLTFARPPGSMH